MLPFEDPAAAGLRICVVGDGLVAGMGDPRGLGWVGRVAARTAPPPGGLGLFPLGVPREGTVGLAARWRGEAGLRFEPGADNRLVVGLGSADLEQGVTLARSRLNLANILDDALADSVKTLVLGPVPSIDGQQNHRLGNLSLAFADVCDRRGVPFVDCFEPLVGHEQWFADLSAGDGRYPGQVGYGLMAWLVLNVGWAAWLGVDDL